MFILFFFCSASSLHTLNSNQQMCYQMQMRVWARKNMMKKKNNKLISESEYNAMIFTHNHSAAKFMEILFVVSRSQTIRLIVWRVYPHTFGKTTICAFNQRRRHSHTHTQPRHTRVHVLHTAETCKLFQIFNPSGIVLYANIFFFFYSAHVNSNLCTLDLMWRQHNHPHSLSALRLIIYAYSDRLVPEGSGVSPTTTQARSERNVGQKSSASLAKLWHIYYYVRANN